jgi:hypothetical protein
MTRLQISFRQRMKKHRHDTLIKRFYEQIKHRLFEARRRRRRDIDETSTMRKIRWRQTMCVRLSANERENDALTKRALIRLFLTKWKQLWNSYQTRNRRKFCETLLKNISFKKIKLHKDLSKSKSSLVTHMKTERIELTDYLFFRRVLTMLTSSCRCEHSRQTLRHVLLFCSKWFEKRSRMLRNDETTNMKRLFNSSNNLKAAINWLMRINLLRQFSLAWKYLD